VPLTLALNKPLKIFNMTTKLMNVLKDQHNGIEKRLLITVQYDLSNNQIVIESIIAEEQRYFLQNNIITYSPLTSQVEVTDLMLDNTPSIEEDIKKMAWETIYRESKMGVAA
jgi:hypothetical protein